jgi:hypothetical protein
MNDRTRLWPLRRVATRFIDPRSSGRLYRTPVNVFRRGDTFLFFLTYGSDVQWVKNVLAAGDCTIETRNETLDLVDPE